METNISSFFSTISEVTFSKIEFIKYLFLFCEIPNVSTGLMWFMYAYLAVLVFFPISYFLFSGGREGKKILKFVTVALFCGSVLVSVINFVLKEFAEIIGCGILEVNSLTKVLPFGGYINMLFYFVLGAFLFSARNETKKWLKQKKYRKCIPLMLIGLGIFGLLVIKFCDMGSFRWNAKYLQNGYNRLSTCILALGMYGAVQQQEGSKIGHFFAKYVGKETMGIFYLHFPVLALYWKYWNEAFKPYYSLGLNLVKTCIVIVICIVITRILKKIPIIRQLVM